MTTSQSPEHVLRAQASKIVEHLAKVPWPKDKAEIKIGIAMDDKVITMTLPREVYKKTRGKALVEYIYKYMKGETEQ